MLNRCAKDILQAQCKILMSKAIRSDYVFCGEDGSQLNQRKVYRRWIRFRDQNGLDKASPHELRHTFISIAQDLPDSVLKQIAGHSRTFDTRGIYAHELKGHEEHAAQLVSDALQKAPEM